jgi:hypothetical protein
VRRRHDRSRQEIHPVNGFMHLAKFRTALQRHLATLNMPPDRYNKSVA